MTARDPSGGPEGIPVIVEPPFAGITRIRCDGKDRSGWVRLCPLSAPQSLDYPGLPCLVVLFGSTLAR
ncbi:hypothetical protein MUNTM_31370 [Mycobacterium sp. MUNTM1]